MDKLKRDPSYSIDAIRPVTHVCKARAARARVRIPTGQTANPRKTIKDIYKTIDRCAIKWLFKVIFRPIVFVYWTLLFRLYVLHFLKKLL